MRAEFEVHMLNEEGKKKAAEIANEFNGTLITLEMICGKEGREMAIVRTKLEEGCFFAKKAMAKNLQNQQPKE